MAVFGGDNGLNGYLDTSNFVQDMIGKGIGMITGEDYDGNYNIKTFLNKLSNSGVMLQSFYECSFSLIPTMTFYVTDIQTPDIQREFQTLYIDGREVYIPSIIEYGHTAELTILNDERGEIYTNFVEALRNITATNGLVKLALKTLGQSGKSNSGMTINMNGARIERIGGLHFSSSDSSIQYFNVTFKVMTWTVSPTSFRGAVKNAVLNTIGSSLVNSGLPSLL